MDKSFKHTAQRLLVEGFTHNFNQMKERYDNLKTIIICIDNHISKKEIDDNVVESICHSRHYSDVLRKMIHDMEKMFVMLENINDDFNGF